MHQPEKMTVRARQMYALVEKYFSSNLSRKIFCEREGITYSTFQWWLGQYRQTESSSPHNSDQIDAFIPIHVAESEIPDSRPSSCQIEYPNGVIVRLGHADVQLIRELVQAGNN